MVRRMCDAAGITGYKTNHSLRATTCTLGLQKGIPEKLIMERSGHRSIKSLHSYQRANDAGDVFPLWGTCLGFQMLHVLAANGKDVLTRCKGENVSLPLNFTRGYEESRMFGKAPEDVKTYLAKLPITLNMHQNCVSVQTYKERKSLNTFMKVLSTNMDLDNKVHFLSTVEAVKYPFYGSQWHPEKNQFEWTTVENINHSKEAIIVTQYVADFFVDQARLSKHHFPSKKEETSSLIYNYKPHPCLPDISHYEQCYFF